MSHGEIVRAFVVKHVRRETSTRPLSHITCDSGRRVRPASRFYSGTLRSGLFLPLRPVTLLFPSYRGLRGPCLARAADTPPPRRPSVG